LKLLVLNGFVPTADSPGAGIFVRRRVQAMRELGADVRLLSPYTYPVSPIPMRGFARREDVENLPEDWKADQLPTPVPVGVVRKGLQMYGWHRPVARAAAKKICQLVGSDVDFVVGHAFNWIQTPLIAEELAKVWDVPFGTVAHGSDIRMIRDRDIRSVSSTLSKADASIFVSQELLANAQQKGLHPKNPQVVANGVDKSVFEFRGGERQGPLRVLFVGNLIPVKGADRLPAIMRSVWRCDADADLTVVGQGPLMGELEAKLGERTRFLGQLEQRKVADEMAQADVLIAPSRSEGFPCAVVEARSTGTPVVGTDVGGLAEAVAHGGAVVGSGNDFNPEEFAKATIDTARSDDRHKVAQLVPSWHDVAEQELAIYEDACREFGR
jgi:teichuronic acid biosynthesis glycosyltransferase TuaC